MMRVIDVQYSPDGLLLGARVEDGTAQLWDAETGVPIGPRFVFEVETQIPSRPTTLTFSPDAKHLVTAGSAGDVIAWDLDPERLADRVCQLAGRNLTRSEWDRHMPEEIDYRKTCPQWPEAALPG
jgi:WD40 repeat protein